MQDNGRDQKKVVQTQNSITDPIVFLQGLGLKEVSDKTFIKKKNLKALLEKDFVNLDKTKAFGFIQILEREFSINLKGLRDDFSSYHQELQHRKTKPVPEVEARQETVSPVAQKESKVSETVGAFVKDAREQVEENTNKSFLMPLLMGVGLLSAGWLLYSLSGEENTKEVVQTQVQEDRPFVEAQVEQVQESLLAMDGEQESPSDIASEDLDKAVKEMFQSQDTHEVADSAAVAPATQTPAKEMPNNSETPTVIVDAAVQNKSNKSIEQAVQRTDKSPSSIKVPQEERMPLLEDTPEDKTTTASKSTTKNVQQTVQSSKSPKASASTGLVIEPMRKSWIQVVDLGTHKKKEYLIRKPLKLSSSKKLLIMVGDKDFKIKNNQKSFHFKSQKAVYFLNQNGKLKELSKGEYAQHLGDVH